MGREQKTHLYKSRGVIKTGRINTNRKAGSIVICGMSWEIRRKRNLFLLMDIRNIIQIIVNLIQCSKQTSNYVCIVICQINCITNIFSFYLNIFILWFKF